MEAMETAKVKFNPKLWTLMFELGGIYVQRGINNFDDWSRKMTEDIGKKSVPWQKAIWTAPSNVPEGAKFDREKMMALTQCIGALREQRIAESFEDVQKEFERNFGKDFVRNHSPMIRASYKGIDRYFADLERNPPPVVEKLRWDIAGTTLYVGGINEIKDFSHEELP